MAKFCTCEAAVVAKFGYEILSGKMICKNCSLPDIESSQTTASSVLRAGEEAVEGNFLNELFDLKIDNYISVKFSRFIYGLSIAIYALLTSAIFIFAISNVERLGPWTALVLLSGVVLFFVLTILARLSTELFVVIFQIARDIRTLAERR